MLIADTCTLLFSVMGQRALHKRYSNFFALLFFRPKFLPRLSSLSVNYEFVECSNWVLVINRASVSLIAKKHS